MPFPILPSNSATGYFLTNSLRFRASATANLQRTPATTTSQTTWTWSGWVKRGQLSTSNAQYLFGTYPSSGQTNSNWIEFGFYTDNTLAVGGWTVRYLGTTQVFRDPSAWYHIVLAIDSTQATGSNRVKLYVNGVQITAFATNNAPSLNQTMGGVNSTVVHCIGNSYPLAGTNPFDGYIAENYFIDGQALTPTSFGSFNTLTGVWQPAKYTGTYGTNGFYLPFTNTTSTSTLGNDFSGNGNNWTTNNFSLTAGTTYDSMTDVPTLTNATTANYAVWNPLVLFPNTTYQATMTNANMLMTRSGGGQGGAATTIGVTSGKFYAEMPVTAVGGSVTKLGVMATNDPSSISASSEYALGDTSASVAYRSNGARLTGGTTTNSWGSTYTTGDVIGVAFDADTGKVWFAKNGTWQASGDPAAGTNQAATLPTGVPFYFSAGGESGISISLNCGQQGFTYTPPTGFLALNTFNLPTSTIVEGNTYMDVTTYTGNGSAGRVITMSNMTNVGFAWVKLRSGSDDHRLANTVTGGNRHLKSNATDAESTGTNVIQAFSSNTFTVGSDVSVNGNGSTYVGWVWANDGTSGSSNTAGSVTSTVSANTTAGFSVAIYTTPASGAFTVGHGLGVAPSFIINKIYNIANNWYCYHVSLGNGSEVVLNTTAASVSTSDWNNTSPTSSVFSMGSGWAGSYSMISYCWSEIVGFSKFGSYVGNGLTDGTFVYTGFRPKFIMLKNITSATSWSMLDTSRNTYNISNARLFAESAQAEDTSQDTMDILSNGFKLRATGLGVNGSGNTIIYMAFAENPFKNALAR
jgi:hypothetical protein